MGLSKSFVRTSRELGQPLILSVRIGPESQRLQSAVRIHHLLEKGSDDRLRIPAILDRWDCGAAQFTRQTGIENVFATRDLPPYAGPPSPDDDTSRAYGVGIGLVDLVVQVREAVCDYIVGDATMVVILHQRE